MTIRNKKDAITALRRYLLPKVTGKTNGSCTTKQLVRIETLIYEWTNGEDALFDFDAYVNECTEEEFVREVEEVLRAFNITIKVVKG